MPGTTKAFKAHPGDIVTVEGHKVGDARRQGEILEVLGEPEHEHYRVQWEDGRETVFYPSSDATIRPKARGAKEKR
jgi:Domain of unknown function (DUF1918)